MDNNHTHVYSFWNSSVYICVKSTDIASAIEQLKVTFGESWVTSNLDMFEINWYRSHHKYKLKHK